MPACSEHHHLTMGSVADEAHTPVDCSGPCCSPRAAACGSDSDSSDGGGTAAPADTSVAGTTPTRRRPRDRLLRASRLRAGGSTSMPSSPPTSTTAPEPTGEPLKLGYAADLSDLGGFADAGQRGRGVLRQPDQLRGGVDGVPVELTIQNIEGDPEGHRRAAQDLLDAGVSAILGPPFADFG